jgi:hypothetical protein
VNGVFVSPSGSDANPGTQAAPVRSIGVAAALAASRAVSVIYVGSGSYPGNLTLSGRSLSLLGGWAPTGAGWPRSCAGNVRAQTVIFALDGGPAITVSDGGFLFRSVSVTTVSAGPPTIDTAGASRVGLWATSADVTLLDVGIDATDAVSGGQATTGSSGPGFRPCSGHTDCQAGLPGPPFLSPALASDGGRFGVGGFIAGDGMQGLPGSDGQNGPPGGPGQSAPSCYVGCGCTTNCVSSGPLPQQAPGGRCGCGGRAGLGGGPGRGGGASVAVLAVNSTIRASFSSLAAGRGGNGSSGGPGGLASPGSTGNPVPPLRCQTKPCQIVAGICPNAGCYFGNGPGDEVYIDLMGGVPGGPGGRGADGQQGGSGAGGPSVVLIGASALLLDGGTTLRASDGGVGGPGARSGDSALTQTW